MRSLLFLIGALFLFASCSDEMYPSIVETPTYSYRPGDFVWHELGCTNMAVTKDFYSKLLGWTYEDFNIPGIKYSLIVYNEQHLGGIIETTVGGSNQWVGAISVKKTGAIMDNAKNLGAIELIKSTTLAGRGSIGLLRDPQGAIISIINSFNGDPDIREAATSEFMWMELWSDKPESSAIFYEKLNSYSTAQESVDGKPYWVLNQGESMSAGIIQNPISNMKTQWIPYIRVADPAAVAEEAVSLGGTVLMAPRDDIRDGSVAVLTDPGGAIFCVQKWPIN